MRLINVTTQRLHEFYEEETPRYAILSHTWGEDEVSYDDFSTGRAKDKAAYIKIRYLCNQALEDKLEWAWLDTCCINKDSSAELSEAINSMFRWYKNAQVCYAYFDDYNPERFGINLNLDIDTAFDPPLLIARFRNAKWFSRGWTLQELLAPPIVRFYSSRWSLIGTREQLAHIMSPFIGIREEVLQKPQAHISRCSVAEKMSWAAKRKTSRKEDRAYCLLGLFEVNMPMLYGEGDRAFLRLQEEIIKTTDDHSIFVWQPQDGDERHLLLAPSPDRFTQGELIVTIPQLHHVDGHTLGNTGLRIKIPVVPSGVQDCWHGVLGCRYRNDYQNVIALCLQSRHSQDSAPGTFFVSPTIARHHRYVLQKTLQWGSQLPQTITAIISRSMPKAAILAETAGATYWVHIPDKVGASVVGAYPASCFDTQTQVMNLAGRHERYGAVLLAMKEGLIPRETYQQRPQHLAIVFGGWDDPSTPARASQDHVGIFGIVESSLKNLENACRLAVSRSIYRSLEHSHVAWLRSVYTVQWSDDLYLVVTFKNDRKIGLLQECVNLVHIELRRSSWGKLPMSIMPLVKQTEEPEVNPLGVQRLQDVVAAMQDDEDESGDDGLFAVPITPEHRQARPPSASRMSDPLAAQSQRRGIVRRRVAPPLKLTEYDPAAYNSYSAPERPAVDPQNHPPSDIYGHDEATLSATYLPGDDSWGSGVGIPPLGRVERRATRLYEGPDPNVVYELADDTDRGGPPVEPEAIVEDDYMLAPDASHEEMFGALPLRKFE